MIELGRYQLVDRLGSGSLTEAYRAKSFGVEGFEKTICVKRLLPGRAELSALVTDFLELAQTSLALSHAGVAQVIDLGRVRPADGGREEVFVVTELVEGVDLASLLSRARTEGVELPLGAALLVGAEVARSLGHAHRRRSGAVLHGGLTPRSVFVSWEGEVKVTDFAIGRTLGRARFVSDPERVLPYQAPELEDGAASAGGDLFALGAILFALITGQPAFAGGRSRTQAPRAASVRKGLPASLDALVARMLAPLAERVDDASGLHEELLAAAYASGTGHSARDLAEFVSRLVRRPDRGGALDAEATLLLQTSTPTPRAVGVSRAEKREASLLVLDGLGPASEQAGLREALVDRVERAGGVVASSDAAELRAVFGLVDPDGRDVHAAAELSLALVAEHPALGVGIDLGRVTADESGSLVNDADLQLAWADAARLAAGQRGHVRLTPRAGRALGAEFELVHAPGDQLRLGRRHREGAPPTRFVGRRAELGALGKAFAAALQGEPRCVVVLGERGIGKSRVLAEMSQRLGKLPSGVEVVRASCPRDLSGAPPALGGLGALCRSLSGIRGDLEGSASSARLARGAGPDRDDGVRRLRALGLDEDEVEDLTLIAAGHLAPMHADDRALRRVARAFEHAVERLTRDRPLVLVLDDAQYLDGESASALIDACSASGRRLLVLMASRTLPATLARPDTVELALPPLDADAVSAMAASLLGARVLPPDLVAYVDERAQGNPLAVELVLRELGDAALVTVRRGVAEADLARARIPRGLRAIVEGKIGRVGESARLPSARAVLRAMAVLGPAATPEELATLSATTPTELEAILEAAETAPLLEGGRPRHLIPSMSEVVLDTIPPDERAELHRRAAQLVEEGAPSAERLDRVATHLQEAGATGEAAIRFAEAARLHVRADLKARSLASALGMAPLDEVPVAEVARWLSLLCEATGRGQVRARLGELAPVLLERIDAAADPAASLTARLDLARLSALDNAFEEAHVLLDGARRLAGDGAVDPRIPGVEVELAARSGEVERGRGAARELVRLASSDPSGGAPVDARVLLEAASVLTDVLDLEGAAEAVELAFEASLGGSAVLRASIEVRRGELALAAGEPALAQRSALLGADLGEAHQLSHEVARAKLLLGHAYRALGRRERAFAAYVEAVEAAEVGGHERLGSLARTDLLLLEGLAGDQARVRSAADAIARAVREASARGFVADAITMALTLHELLASAAPDDAAATTERAGAFDEASRRVRALGHPRLSRELDRRRGAGN